MRRSLAVTIAVLIEACGSATGPGPGTGTDGTVVAIDGSSSPFIDAGNPLSATDAACDVQVEPIETSVVPAPHMMLVVDRSASMYGGKWNTMSAAVMDVVDAYEGAIHFGLIPYPSDALCAVDVAAPIAPSNRAEIAEGLATPPDIGGTPSHLALQMAGSYFASEPASEADRYVLLASDGNPTCGDSPEGGATQAAVESLASEGIATFVLGFHYDAHELLTALAQLGGTGTYYSADTPESLHSALAAIAEDVHVPPCTYGLAWTPQDYELLTVTFDGAPVGLSVSHTDGWNYESSSNTISFYGAACDALQSGQVDELRVEFGCAGPVVL